MTTVAALQMVSSTHVADNLAVAATLIARAAQQGATLLVLPEYFCLMGRQDTDKIAIREPASTDLMADSTMGPIQTFLATQAKQHGVWLVGGTIPLSAPRADQVWNSTLVFNPAGEQVARYDKIHLFSFSQGAESYDEAQTIAQGTLPIAFTGPCGRVGLSICYDLRFPELYRALAHTGNPEPLNLLLVPAAFTYTTGQAHWEILLRARAIENQCYVLASAQGGKHENGRRTWGHSMLIDPWGEIIDVLPEGPGIVMGALDLEKLTTIRHRLPALQHRKL